MKKLLVLVPIFLLLGTISAMAQQGGGGQGNFREMQKQRLKDSLGLTDVQIDTVMNIQQEFQPRMRELRELSDADRQAKMKVINDDKHKRLAAALKDEALATKIDEFNARLMQGMRGGGRPRGNK